jgi:hypothetical protein
VYLVDDLDHVQQPNLLALEHAVHTLEASHAHKPVAEARGEFRDAARKIIER